MGSSIALKILNIDSNELLKQTVFMDNKHLLPYLYFITRINKFFVEDFKQDQTVKNFTIYNVITKKEYNIIIEPLQTEKFLKGLVYEASEYPNYYQALVVSDIEKGSLSEKCGIVKREMMLLGTTKKYLFQISEVGNEIQKGNEEFVFYNFKKDYVVVVNFKEKKEKEGNKDKGGLGFELQEVDINNFYKYFLYEKQEEEEGKMDNGEVNNVNEVNDNSNKEIISEDNKEIKDTCQHGEVKKEDENKEIENINDNKEEQQHDVVEKLPQLQDVITENVVTPNDDIKDDKVNEEVINDNDNKEENIIKEEIKETITTNTNNICLDNNVQVNENKNENVNETPHEIQEQQPVPIKKKEVIIESVSLMSKLTPGDILTYITEIPL